MDDPRSPASEPLVASRDERLLSLDEARAAVARSMASALRKSIEELEAQGAHELLNTEKNRQGMIYAAKELHDNLLLHARKLSAPRILHPNRTLKLTR